MSEIYDPDGKNLSQQLASGVVDERRYWRSVDERALLELNKTIATFSPAVLAASIAFIKGAYTPRFWWDSLLLFASWAPFFFAIFFVLDSYKKHRLTTREWIEYNTIKLRGDDTAEVELSIKVKEEATAKSSGLSGKWFTVGLAMTALFVFAELVIELSQPNAPVHRIECQTDKDTPCLEQKLQPQFLEKSRDSVRELQVDSTKSQ